MAPDSRPDWRPSASRLALEARAALLAAIRTFFSERKVLEVETPLLSAAGNTDTAINSMRVESTPPRYLRTSPEYPLKRLLAAGVGDVYELGRVFRGGERGQWHNPEFTLLEWYRNGWTYLELADEVVALIRHCGAGRFDDWQVSRITYRDLFLQKTGLDPFHTDTTECASLALERGIHSGPLDEHQWLDLILTHLIQPALGGERITVVHEYPPEQAALARVMPGSLPVAERFEVYLGETELANGYQELGDAAEQQRRFEHDNRLRAIRGDDAPPIDQHLIMALQHGLPECSGVALGVDRLLMAILQLDRIDGVLAFPAERA